MSGGAALDPLQALAAAAAADGAPQRKRQRGSPPPTRSRRALPAPRPVPRPDLEAFARSIPVALPFPSYAFSTPAELPGGSGPWTCPYDLCRKVFTRRDVMHAHLLEDHHGEPVTAPPRLPHRPLCGENLESTALRAARREISAAGRSACSAAASAHSAMQMVGGVRRLALCDMGLGDGARQHALGEQALVELTRLADLTKRCRWTLPVLAVTMTPDATEARAVVWANDAQLAEDSGPVRRAGCMEMRALTNARAVLECELRQAHAAAQRAGEAAARAAVEVVDLDAEPD